MNKTTRIKESNEAIVGKIYDGEDAKERFDKPITPYVKKECIDALNSIGCFPQNTPQKIYENSQTIAEFKRNVEGRIGEFLAKGFEEIHEELLAEHGCMPFDIEVRIEKNSNSTYQKKHYTVIATANLTAIHRR